MTGLEPKLEHLRLRVEPARLVPRPTLEPRHEFELPHGCEHTHENILTSVFSEHRSEDIPALEPSEQSQVNSPLGTSYG